MTIHPAAGLDVGNRGQIAAGDIAVKIGGVNDVGSANGVVGHDLRLIMERVADVAVLVAVRADGAVVELVFVGEVPIPLIAIVFPGDVLFKEHVGDAALVRPGNRKRSVIRKVIGVGVSAIAKISRVVVVQQVVVAFLAVRVDWPRERPQVFADLSYARLLRVGAVAISSATANGGAETAATVSILNPPVVGAGNRVGVLDFVHGAGVRRAAPDEFVVRRPGWFALGVAKPNGIAKTQHDAGGARSAQDRLVIVVAHLVLIG